MKKLVASIIFLIFTLQIFAFDIYPGEKKEFTSTIVNSFAIYNGVNYLERDLPDFLEFNALQIYYQDTYWGGNLINRAYRIDFELTTDAEAPLCDTVFYVDFEFFTNNISQRKDTLQINVSIVSQQIEAGFTADIRKGPNPLTVQFTNTSTGKYTDLIWDFGDGETSVEENPVHTFTSADMFDVQLIAYSETDADTLLQENYIETFNMPVATVEGGGGICPGDSVQVAFKFTGSPPWKFTYTNGSEEFQDSTTFPKYSFFVNEAGSFNLTELRDFHDTLVTTFGAPLEVWLHPVPAKPEIAYEKSITICEGESILLSGPNDVDKYFWTNAEKTQTIEISENTVVALKVANEFGCESPLSDSLEIEVMPVPEKPEIQQNTDTLFISGEADFIQWYKNGELMEDANSTRLEFTESANYRVEVFNEHGCGRFSDEAYYVISDAFHLAEIEDFFEVFPNPFNDYLQVIFSGKTTDLQSWKLMQSNGETVQSYIYNSDAPGNFRINTAGLPAGIYFLKIRSKNLETLRKLVKK